MIHNVLEVLSSKGTCPRESIRALATDIDGYAVRELDTSKAVRRL
jgi:hypothetical protein